MNLRRTGVRWNLATPANRLTLRSFCSIIVLSVKAMTDRFRRCGGMGGVWFYLLKNSAVFFLPDLAQPAPSQRRCTPAVQVSPKITTVSNQAGQGGGDTLLLAEESAIFSLHGRDLLATRPDSRNTLAMRRFLLPLALMFVSHATFAAPPPGDKDRDVGARLGDAVSQPLSDANLQKKKVADVLKTALDDPYAKTGTRTCNQIIAQVTELDEALGPDLDSVEAEPDGRKRREGVGRVATGLVTSFIPFRFLIREVTGASQAERDYRAAVLAGVVRRSYLKGIGQQRRCLPPGRPASRMERASDAASTLLDVKEKDAE